MPPRQKPKRTRTQNLEATHMTISEVAILLSQDAIKHGEKPFKYQRTRDLVLTGQLGIPEIHNDRIYVPRTGVEKAIAWNRQIQDSKKEKSA